MPLFVASRMPEELMETELRRPREAELGRPDLEMPGEAAAWFHDISFVLVVCQEVQMGNKGLEARFSSIQDDL